MDPFTAILLVGLMTVATVKTGGAAVNDGIASARGHTPPSQERWRAREERRRQRGEQPRQDPGGIKRIWSNQMDFAAEKSAKKHQGRMEYLAEHGDEIAAGKRGRMERADRRRQLVGGVLASAGGSSWGALKTAAQKASDARHNHAERNIEQAAWRENERRDAAGGTAADSTDESGVAENDEGADATVLDFNRKALAEQDEIVRRWRAALASGPGHGDRVLSAEEWNSLPGSVRDQLIQDAEDAGAIATETKQDGQERALRPDTDRDGGQRGVTNRNREWATGPQSGPPITQQQAATGTDPEHDFVRDPDRPGHTVSVAELQRRRDEQSRERQRQHDAAEAQAAREHTERMAGARPASTDESETETEQDSTGSNTESAAQENQEGTNMPQPQSGTTEITDLTTAQMRAKESQQYAGKVQAVLSDQLASIQAAIAGMQSEAQMQESGSGSLAGEGFTSRITGRFDSGAEKYHNAVAALQKQVTAAQTALEEVETAAAEMKAAATFFGKQQSLADEVGAAKQDGGVSKRTDFYANSGA